MRNQVLAVVALLACVHSHAQTGIGAPDRWVTLDKQAVLAMPPELIAAPTVTRTSLSPKGRFLLAIRKSVRLEVRKVALEPGKPPAEVPVPSSAETAVVWWDSSLHEAREIWRTNQAAVDVHELVWVGNTDTALIVLVNNAAERGQPRFGLQRIGPNMQRAQPLALPDGLGNLTVISSPTKPEVALLMWPDMKPDAPLQKNLAQIALFRETVPALKPVALPEGYYPFGVVWVGDRILIQGSSKNAGGKGLQWLEYNAVTGAISPAQPPPAVTKTEDLKPQAPDIRLITQESTVGTGPAKGTSKALVLLGKEGTEKPRAILSFESDGGSLHPSGKFVLFQAQGAMFASELLRTDKATFLAAREAAERTTLLSNAKQVALAAMMYAADYDDTLPGGDGVQDKLMPYLKNDVVMKGMVFTFGGGPLKDVQNPASTEMGHIPGPGGRAVFYVDGHAKWIKTMP